ncbi:hypothetical protein SUGI_0364070 [Cryptomeria japonica]|nr:hypothetical protein SUGI_0364070 [Cryptomeria japonica]
MPVAPNCSLQELNVMSYSRKTLPEELQSSTALKTPKLYDWDEMELREAICGLHWLSTLSLVSCGLKDLPPSFGDLISLTNLALEYCDKLEELPSSTVKLKALRYLNRKGRELTALQGLNMKKCIHIEEVPGFKQLTELRYLNIQECTRLRGDFSNTGHKALQIVK